MGWQDRDYYRDGSQSPISGPLGWILYGSVPLFTAFNIRVRAHASLIIFAILILLFGWGSGSDVSARVYSITALFAIILLHEFGHCFAARFTGGTANDILMTPLGGLAMAGSRNKPWPRFFTVAGGPLVNVVLCLISGALFLVLAGRFPLTPGQFVSAYIEVARNTEREGGLPLDLAYLAIFSIRSTTRC